MLEEPGVFRRDKGVRQQIRHQGKWDNVTVLLEYPVNHVPVIIQDQGCDRGAITLKRAYVRYVKRNKEKEDSADKDR